MWEKERGSVQQLAGLGAPSDMLKQVDKTKPMRHKFKL